MDDLMTIGTFARRVGLSVSAVRFYADRGLLVPAEVDPASGYRRYHWSQIDDGVTIRNLRRLDMPLASIAEALARPPDGRAELIEHQLHRLELAVTRAHTVARTLGVGNGSSSTADGAGPDSTGTTTGGPSTAHGEKGDRRGPTRLPAAELARAIDQVLPAAGGDPERPHLHVVLIESGDGSLRLVATDRHRLTLRDIVPTALGAALSVVVSAASLARWRHSLDGGRPVALTVDAGRLLATGPAIDLEAPVVPIPFPTYQRILRPVGGTTVVVDRHRLVGALDELTSPTTDRRSSGAGSHGAVTVATGPASLVLARGGLERALDATVDGPDRWVALDPAYMADAAGRAVGAELVVEIEDRLRPVVLRSADDGAYLSLIMPIRLDDSEPDSGGR